jgi:hypothetical protein
MIGGADPEAAASCDQSAIRVQKLQVELQLGRGRNVQAAGPRLLLHLFGQRLHIRH